MPRIRQLTSLLCLALSLTGCPERDPIERAMEEMDLAGDTELILIGDEEPPPEPKARSTSGGKMSGRTAGSSTSSSATSTAPTISEDDVVQVVKRHKGQVRACYEKELKSDPSLIGIVVVAWTVTAAGGVHGTRVISNSTGNTDMESCITRVVEGWAFPASGAGDVDIEYPFRFVPGL
jgi:outer membrane biosynthesis protein TonB